MGTTESARIVERVIALMGEQDWDAVAELFHDDVTIEWPQSGERLRGKQACLAVFSNYPGGAPKLELDRVVADGDVATVQTRMTYPDGSTWHGVQIMELRDGKVARETDYFAEPFPAPEWRAEWVESVT
jgi:ketosteroid isomerase-like protein